jgi:hypothetical protein
VLSDPDGWPIWVSGVRPGREHDVTCAKAASGLIGAIEQAAAEGILTLTGLGYEGAAGPALRMPVKKPQGDELTEAQRQYNLLVRGVHPVAERANSLLKATFKALRRMTPDDRKWPQRVAWTGWCKPFCAAPGESGIWVR